MEKQNVSQSRQDMEGPGMELTAAQVANSLTRAFPSAPRTKQARESAATTIAETQRYLFRLLPADLMEILPVLMEALLDDRADSHRRRRMVGYVVEHLNVLCLRPEEDYSGVERFMGGDLAQMAREDDRDLAASKLESYASFTAAQAGAIVVWLTYVRDHQLAPVWDEGELEAAIEYWSSRMGSGDAEQ